MSWIVGLDERLFLAINGWSSPWLDALLCTVTWLGNGVVMAVLALGGMALLDRRRLRAHAGAMVLSVAMGALAVEAVKSIADRDRPARHLAARVERGEVEVRMPVDRLLDRSFPSGHSQAAFGAATYLSLVYPFLAPPLLALAALVALSRVYLGVHFPFDVLVGALVGACFSIGGFMLRRRLAQASASATSRGG